MSSGLKKSLITIAVSGLLMSSASYATNGYFAHGYSTKEKGLAGAGVAYSQDAMSIANNPAGIAFIGERMDIGAAIFNPNRGYTVTGAAPPAGTSIDAFCGAGSSFDPMAPNFGLVFPCQPSFSINTGSVDSEADYFLIPHFAYNWRLNQDSALALAVYGNGGMNTRYKEGSARLLSQTTFSLQDFPGTFGAGTAGVNLAQLFFNLSYAKKLDENSSWGAGVVFAYQQFKADGLAQFSGYSLDPQNLTNNGHDTSVGMGAKIGWQGKVAPDVTLGATYQTKISMSEFDEYSGLFAEGGDFDIPASLGLGLAWDTSEKSKLLVDVQVIYYSDVAAIANPMSNLTGGQCLDPLNAVLSGSAANMPSAGSGEGCLGGAYGAGFGWNDMTILKLGYQWEANDIIWRAGLSHGDQPIPDSEVLFNVLAPGVIETHLTFGFTMPLGADSEFSFSGMYAPSNSVSGPNPLDGGATTIELEMDQFELQGTYSMKF